MGRSLELQERARGCGFSRAALTHEPERFSFPYLEADAIHRADGPYLATQ